MDHEHEEGDDGPTRAEVVARYWKMRRRCTRALVVLAGASSVLVVFHEPRAWGDGELARALYGLAWVLLVCAGVVAYRANARMAEARGYCEGRFGQRPTEQSAEPPSVRPPEKPSSR